MRATCPRSSPTWLPKASSGSTSLTRSRPAAASPGRKELHDDSGHVTGARVVTTSFLIELTILILAAFLGVEVISKVPTLLHTPLMSGTNAIHGIVLVGAIIVAGIPGQPTWLRIVTLAAVALGTGNVVGGFVVTDRMLEMFKPKRKTEPEAESKQQ